MTVEHKSWFLSPACHEWRFSISCNNWPQFGGFSYRLHKQHDWGRHRMFQPFYTNQLFPAPPFTLPVQYLKKKCPTYMCIVQCPANLSGPYLLAHMDRICGFSYLPTAAVPPVKNCQWWHLSNVTKVKRQSCSSDKDKKFNYKTLWGKEERSHCAIELISSKIIQGNITAANLFSLAKKILTDFEHLHELKSWIVHYLFYSENETAPYSMKIIYLNILRGKIII